MKADRLLPWIKSAFEFDLKTLKFEVTYQGVIVLVRIIHIGKLYPQQYPKIALQVCNSIIQN